MSSSMGKPFPKCLQNISIQLYSQLQDYSSVPGAREKVELFQWAILLKRQGKDWAPLPDLTYISYERLPKSWKRNEACPALPELVIEIISPDQTMKEFEDIAVLNWMRYKVLGFREWGIGNR